MKTLFASFLLTLVLVAFSGCTRSSAEGSASPRAKPAAVYKAGHGLQLTPLAREFNGITVVEFGDRIPTSAVFRTVEGTFVYVENGEWFLRTRVTVERTATADSFALKDGLYEGDRIVSGGVRALWLAELHFLRAGQACAHEG
jgi:hypothetical protein